MKNVNLVKCAVMSMVVFVGASGALAETPKGVQGPYPLPPAPPIKVVKSPLQNKIENSFKGRQPTKEKQPMQGFILDPTTGKFNKVTN